MDREIGIEAELRRGEIARNVAALRGDRAPSPPPGASGVRVRVGWALIAAYYRVAPKLRPQ